MRRNQTSFMHFRHFKDDQLQPKGGVTIAYKLIYKIESDEYPVGLEYNFSLCNSKDHYNRHIGCMISAGRLRKYPEYSNFEDSQSWFNELEERIIAYFLSDDGCTLVNTSRGELHNI